MFTCNLRETTRYLASPLTNINSNNKGQYTGSKVNIQGPYKEVYREVPGEFSNNFQASFTKIPGSYEAKRETFFSLNMVVL